MSADAATPGLPVMTGRPGHLQRAGAALFLSALCHTLVVLTLAQHAGDVLNRSAPAPDASTAPIMVARLTNLADKQAVDVPSPLLTAPSEITENKSKSAATTAAATPTTNLPSSASSGTPLGRDSSHYYVASELDRRPTPLTPVNLPYPGADPQAEGYLLLQLYISEKGRVDKVEVMLNDGADLIAPIAAKVFGDVVFSPGLRKERPVKSRMLIELKLRPEVKSGR